MRRTGKPGTDIGCGPLRGLKHILAAVAVASLFVPLAQTAPPAAAYGSIVPSRYSQAQTSHTWSLGVSEYRYDLWGNWADYCVFQDQWVDIIPGQDWVEEGLNIGNATCPFSNQLYDWVLAGWRFVGYGVNGAAHVAWAGADSADAWHYWAIEYDPYQHHWRTYIDSTEIDPGNYNWYTNYATRVDVGLESHDTGAYVQSYSNSPLMVTYDGVHWINWPYPFNIYWNKPLCYNIYNSQEFSAGENTTC